MALPHWRELCALQLAVKCELVGASSHAPASLPLPDPPLPRSQEIGFITIMAVSESVMLLAIILNFFMARKKEDVVELRGENEDYRGCHTLAMMRRLGSENVKIYSKICTSKLQAGAEMDKDVSDGSQVSGAHGKHVRDCKIQRGKKPNIPANRLALDKGMLQYCFQTKIFF
eukprot:Gb_09678 [translate_table: standard]